VALFQTKRLREEFGAEIEWRGFELFPDELEWPDWGGAPSTPPPANKPPVPSRFDFILAADGVTVPPVERPKKMRTHNAHEALEYAKTEGVADAFAEVLYRALWERGEEINNPDVLLKLAEGAIKDIPALEEAIKTRRFKDAIVGFDDAAYAMGVYNVPTYYIGGERYAEQPYVRLREAVEKVI
jgi:predicted DsbA family dithiol-disulfide isomerase